MRSGPEEEEKFQGRLVQEANDSAQPQAEVGGGLAMVKSIQAQIDRDGILNSIFMARNSWVYGLRLGDQLLGQKKRIAIATVVEWLWR